MAQNPLNSLRFSSLWPQAGAPEMESKPGQKREQKHLEKGPEMDPQIHQK